METGNAAYYRSVCRFRFGMSEKLNLLHQFLSGEASQLQRCDVEHGTNYEKLTVKQNVCYIVVGIVVNDKDEVLMVQEAKPSCYKKWYLPAGRMEPNENIVEAVKREVLEEAGLEFEPSSLLCVEECGGRWVRFLLSGKVVGGKLKTTDRADEESLQAMWWDRAEDIQIRCMDILPLIKLGMEHKNGATRFPPLLPTLQPHAMLFLKILVVYTWIDPATQSHEQSMLFAEDGENCANGPRTKYRVPTSRIHPEDGSFHTAVKALCEDALNFADKTSIWRIPISGVVAVEHIGASSRNQDGLGISVVAHIPSEDGDPIPQCKTGYEWVKINDIADEATARTVAAKLDPGRLVQLRSLKASL